MAERLKRGQQVTIRADLQVGKAYGGLRVVEGMAPHLGKETEVTYVYEDNYDLAVDSGKHGWTDRMLIPRQTKEKSPR